MEEESLFRDIHAHLLRKAQTGDVDTEAGLAETFGVSRYRIRRVLDKLEQMGVVERAQKRGVTVVPADPKLFASNVGALVAVSNFDVREIIEARRRMGEDLIELAARRLTPSSAGRLVDLVEQMVRCVDFHAATMRFHADLHDLLAEASGNRVLCGITSGLIALMRGAFDKMPEMEHEVVSGIVSADRDLIEALRRDAVAEAKAALHRCCALEEKFLAR